jgi:CheY-like chemotaxis protein
MRLIAVSKQVMVVDDDAEMRDLVCLLLEQQGLRVQQARSSIEALALLQELIPDLFVLDIRMPGMGGIELCRQIRAQTVTRHTPIILLSAHSDPQTVESGYLAGATDFVAKPFSNAALMVSIQNALNLQWKAHCSKGTSE